VAKWTVMMFMGADGVEGNVPLEKEADDDIEELKGIPPSDNLQILIDRHGPGNAGRFRIEKGKLLDEVPKNAALAKAASLSSPEAFASGAALRDFVTSSLWSSNQEGAQAGAKPNTMLVLWGHAYDFTFGPAATRFGIDALDYGEIAGVLSEVTNKGQNKLDIVAFDACAIATLEIAYQFEPFAKYLVASQIGVPRPGFPYKRAFERLAAPLRNGTAVSDLDASQLGSYIVRRYCEAYQSSELPVSLSHLDLRQVRPLAALTDQLASALAIAMEQDESEQALVSEVFRLAQTLDEQPFVDVASLSRLLFRFSGDDEVRAAAKALGDAVLAPVAPVRGRRTPFVIENGFNSIETAGLSGVSLYAPNVAPNHDFAAAGPFYEKLAFARETLWRDLVRALALPDQVCC
jgi:hypothetical protein